MANNWLAKIWMLLVGFAIAGFVIILVLGLSRWGPVQSSSCGIGIKAHYGLFGELTALVIVRKANSKWPESAFESYPGNLALIDARTSERLVLDIPRSELAQFWKKWLGTVSVVESMQWLADKVPSEEGRRLIAQMMEESHDGE